MRDPSVVGNHRSVISKSAQCHFKEMSLVSQGMNGLIGIINYPYRINVHQPFCGQNHFLPRKPWPGSEQLSIKVQDPRTTYIISWGNNVVCHCSDPHITFSGPKDDEFSILPIPERFYQSPDTSSSYSFCVAVKSCSSCHAGIIQGRPSLLWPLC